VRAWVIREPGPVAGRPLHLEDRPDPVPEDQEILVRVSACGVCRTDLHVAEGDLPIHRPRVVPGHEVVGIVESAGRGAHRFELGERVGIPWLRSTCGVCRFCRRGQENLCLDPRYTGWDADGGYAEMTVVDERYAYRLPVRYDDRSAAPLLCAGIVGYRALRRAELPPGGRLGIYGFGASAHLVAQVALHQGAEVHVRTRSAAAQRLALELGCASATDTLDPPPEPLDAAIVFAPDGDIVPTALAALDRGATLSLAGIHLSDLPSMPYERLFEERQIRSVTANTRRDGEEFLALADRMDLQVATTGYAFREADRALNDLAAGRVTGAAVVVVDDAEMTADR
jgi:propanol-preferring alcohol dehydrogenase